MAPTVKMELPDPGGTEGRRSTASAIPPSNSPNTEDVAVGGGRFVVLQRIGRGSFGEIYRGFERLTGRAVAIKIENMTRRNPHLLHEWRLYKLLTRVPGVPRVYWGGAEGGYCILVMDLLGPSIEDLFERSAKRFSVPTSVMVVYQMICRLEGVHERGVVHRDIKPHNFTVGLVTPQMAPDDERRTMIYIIDFGLSKRYRDSQHVHMPYRDGRNLTGTARYVSVNTHLGVEPSRRDDLESVLYVLIYLLKAQLPWQGLRAATKKEKYARIMETKTSTTTEVLCAGLPYEIGEALDYCRSLRYTERPDYSALKELLAGVLLKQNRTLDFLYDWSTCYNLNALDAPDGDPGVDISANSKVLVETGEGTKNVHHAPGGVAGLFGATKDAAPDSRRSFKPIDDFRALRATVPPDGHLPTANHKNENKLDARLDRCDSSVARNSPGPKNLASRESEIRSVNASQNPGTEATADQSDKGHRQTTAARTGGGETAGAGTGGAATAGDPGASNPDRALGSSTAMSLYAREEWRTGVPGPPQSLRTAETSGAERILNVIPAVTTQKNDGEYEGRDLSRRSLLVQRGCSVEVGTVRQLQNETGLPYNIQPRPESGQAQPSLGSGQRGETLGRFTSNLSAKGTLPFLRRKGRQPRQLTEGSSFQALGPEYVPEFKGGSSQPPPQKQHQTWSSTFASYLGLRRKHKAAKQLSFKSGPKANSSEIRPHQVDAGGPLLSTPERPRNIPGPNELTPELQHHNACPQLSQNSLSYRQKEIPTCNKSHSNLPARGPSGFFAGRSRVRYDDFKLCREPNNNNVGGYFRTGMAACEDEPPQPHHVSNIGFLGPTSAARPEDIATDGLYRTEITCAGTTSKLPPGMAEGENSSLRRSNKNNNRTDQNNSADPNHSILMGPKLAV